MTETVSAVAAMCAELLRFDTTNHGNGRSAGERALAEHIAGLLRAAGYTPHLLGGSHERANVVLRVPGEDRSLPALLVHAHLDVVPAEASDWSVPPFAGTIRDGYVWGRGAADMKDMVASMLVTLLDWAETTETSAKPRRDVVFAFVADEEDRGEHGALWLAREHPALFDGVAAAIGESGGYPITMRLPDGGERRLYQVATAERGTLHVKLTAKGPAGHGSRPTPESAVRTLLDAVQRVAEHPWPVHLCETVRAFLERATAVLGRPADLTTAAGVLAAVDALGDAGEVARFTIRASATPTVLSAGYKVNVIPSTASAELDVRCPPGYDDTMIAALRELVGERVEVEFTSMQRPVEAPLDSPWFQSIAETIRRTDPEAVVVPYCMGGGTDAKAFSALGILCYGFAPLGHDEGRRVHGVHGVDERVPVAALTTGQRMLADFLSTV